MKSAAAALLVLAWSAYAQAIPAKGVNFYSLEREIALGRQAAANLAATLRFEDPTLKAYLAKLGASVAQSADPHFQYTFAFYDDRKGFAAPSPFWALPADAVDGASSEPIAIAGGPVFVPLSLLANAPNEAAFAFQLAHAVAHVALRHATRAATRAELVEIGMVPVRAQSAQGWARVAMEQGTQLVIPLSMRAFARQSELQADVLAVSLLAAAGYDPLAVVPYLEAQPELRPLVFSAHPSGSRRADAVRDAAGKLPARDYAADTGEFLAMKTLAASQ